MDNSITPGALGANALDSTLAFIAAEYFVTCLILNSSSAHDLIYVRGDNFPEIGGNVVERGWLTIDQLIHYNLHETLDIKHAEDFFTILRTSWNSDPASRNAIEQGLRLGATLFNGLYEGLFRARSRRWMQQNLVHHDINEECVSIL